MYYSIFSLFFYQTQETVEQTPVLFKDKAGNMLYFCKFSIAKK